MQQDEILALATLGEGVLGVVDDVVCAERAYHLHFFSAVDSSHTRTIRPGKLHSDGAHATARPVDQHTLTRLDLSPIMKIV